MTYIDPSTILAVSNGGRGKSKRATHRQQQPPPPRSSSTNSRRLVLVNGAGNGKQSNGVGGHLESWYKVEDNESGVTYFWHTGNGGSVPVIANNQYQTGSGAVAAYAANSSHLLTNGYYSASVHRHYQQQQQSAPSANDIVQKFKENGFFIDDSHSGETRRRSRGKEKTAVVPRSVENPLIWSVENGTKASPIPRKPTAGGSGRKPRTRRFLRTLLCCFGGEPTQPSLPSAPANFADPSSSGHPLTPYSPKQSEKILLPPIRPCDINKKCLIIDLDETLVHSSFKPVKNPDFIIPVEIDGVIHQVYVLKRPFVDEFLQRIGDVFECILFTASLAKYADPVADLLDKQGVFRSRLFRDACVFHKGNYVKDLNRLSRDLKRVIIIDNSPASYAFHPDNALPVSSWFDDNTDTELLDLVPTLERLAAVDNVYPVLRNCNDPTTTTGATSPTAVPSPPMLLSPLR